MQKKGRIAAIIAAIAVVGNMGAAYAEEGKEKKYYGPVMMSEEPKYLRIFDADVIKREIISMLVKKPAKVVETIVKDSELNTEEKVLEVESIPEPRYGVDFTRIRQKYPNKPFVKKVLTDEMQEYLNKREAETGIPGAVIMAQGIWEVGWNLSTPKGGGRDSLNLFNIKNCDGNYVVMAGSKWQCYNSYMESVEGYIELISKQPRYAKAYEHIKNGGDIETYYRLLGDAGYYEGDKDAYVRNCMSIINANKLFAK